MSAASMETGPSLGWAIAAAAVAAVTGGTPLPKGLTKAKVGDWSIRVNNASDPLGNLPPFAIEACHEVVFAFALLSPSGGGIACYPEEKFIDEMAAVCPPDVLADFGLEGRAS